MPPRTTRHILGRSKRKIKDKNRNHHYFLKTIFTIILGFGLGFGVMFMIASLKRPTFDFYISNSEEVSIRVNDEFIDDTFGTVKINGVDESSKVVRRYYDYQFKEIPVINTAVAGTYYIGFFYEDSDYSNVIYKKVSVNEIGPVDDFRIHFLELGNGYFGDSIYIKAGETDVLIDAGSRQNSATVIDSYLKNYVTDGILEYVVATHAHQDHISGFASYDSVDETHTAGIFELYDCKTIIDFPRHSSNSVSYLNYANALKAEEAAGAIHYSAIQCYSNTNGAKRSYELANGITMEILYNYYYDNPANNEDNNSVCLLFNVGDRKVLLTGDLRSDGESFLMTNNPQIANCDVFKANLHGSALTNTSAFLNFIKPKMVAVTCVAGTDETTTIKDNQFPSQVFINTIKPITDQVYVTSVSLDKSTTNFTSLNGNIVMTSISGGEFTVNCSHSNTILKDSEWFFNNRTW